MPSPPDWTRSTFTYEESTGQYRGRNGRFVPRAAVRAELDRVLDGIADDTDNLATMLQNGDISLSEWQSSMMRNIKQSHLIGGATYKGGWAQMTQADYGRVGQTVRTEYEFLERFANQIASGEQRLDGTLGRRAQLYIQQARPTYYKFANADMKTRGFDEERSILNAQESCSSSSRPGCVEEAARGFVPIGELTPIGQRTCLSNDRCSMEYRNSQTGETREI